MSEMTGQDRLRHYALAGGFMVAGPLARELYYARYPLGSPEALILLLGLAVTGAAIAVVGSRLGRYLSGAVFAALFLVFLDLQFDFRRLDVLAGVAAACLVLSLLLSRWRATITGLALGVFYLASLPFRSPDDLTIRNSQQGASGQVALGPIIHIILDEQFGIGGFRGVGDTATAAFLTDFYVRRGFDVYPGAYSRFNVTRESIASVLSLGEVEESALLSPVKEEGSPAPLVSNPYFARLAGQGHLINVYESANLDYCRTGPIATCIKMPPISVANISAMRIPWMQKARFVLEFHLVHSSRLRSLVPLLRDLESRRIFAVRALELLRSAGNDLVKRRNRADFFFAHVLMPHSPNEVDDQCVTYVERVLAPSTFTPTPDSLRTKEARYRAQVRCIHRVLGQFLDQVDEVFGPNRAVIMVHGDHGSRSMYRCEPNIFCRAPAATEEDVKNFRPVDFAGEFSTLLAVRGPDSKGAVHWKPTPTQDFLWAFIKSGFRTVPVTPWQHYIYLNSARRRTAYPLRPADMLWAPGGR
jgi:hypothetical protein